MYQFESHDLKVETVFFDPEVDNNIIKFQALPRPVCVFTMQDIDNRPICIPASSWDHRGVCLSNHHRISNVGLIVPPPKFIWKQVWECVRTYREKGIRDFIYAYVCCRIDNPYLFGFMSSERGPMRKIRADFPEAE